MRLMGSSDRDDGGRWDGVLMLLGSGEWIAMSLCDDHHCPGPWLGDADGLFSGLWVCGVLIQRLFLALLER